MLHQNCSDWLQLMSVRSLHFYHSATKFFFRIRAGRGLPRFSLTNVSKFSCYNLFVILTTPDEEKSFAVCRRRMEFGPFPAEEKSLLLAGRRYEIFVRCSEIFLKGPVSFISRFAA